ncbi:MAG TPA: endolytic transglycosylase MltG [Bacteroidia bacterium]|nr:endolytic transglycosylase MltG [Bacteroidia bacterium]HNT79758.1 endolytic transglycosylase MltG [Bacteroidia bacterium]
MAKKKNKKTKLLRWILMTAIAFALFSGIALYSYYKKVYHSNIQHIENNYLYIPSGSTFDDVIAVVNDAEILIDKASFEWVAKKMEYDKAIKPGRYEIHAGMSNHDLVSLLRSGKQSPIRFTFSSLRSVDRLAGMAGSKFECDSISIMSLLSNTEYIDSLGFTKASLPSLFIPNTYEFYWNTSARQFVDRMFTEHQTFWNEKRLSRLKELGLSKTELVTLASIVEKETNKNDEKAIIAGVYVNRLRDDWKLEADPTLVFANGDFTIKRVLNIHKEIDSPYNTYKYLGLPPGPICIPSIASIEASLNFKNHNYYFFCAREDFSGYHNFAEDYRTHLQNAKKYQRELSKRNINS